MLSSVDQHVLSYLYKCLLRRQQALQVLRPVNIDISPFEEALHYFSSLMEPKDVSDAEKQIKALNNKHIDIYIDASALHHDNPKMPNKASVSFIIYQDGEKLYEKAEFIGSYITLEIENKEVTFDITINVAEYLALIKALEFVVENDFRGNITIYSDSLLIVNQVNFTSSARSPKLIVLRDYANRLKERLRNIKIIHLCRDENTSADALARLSVDKNEQENNS